MEFWPSRWWRIFLFLIITTIDEYNSYVMSWLNGHSISHSKTNLITPNIIEVIDYELIHLTDIISFRIQYTEEWMNLTMWNCLYLFFISSLILGRKPYFSFFPYNPSSISLTVFLSVIETNCISFILVRENTLVPFLRFLVFLFLW